jgi:hypothetical protein
MRRASLPISPGKFFTRNRSEQEDFRREIRAGYRLFVTAAGSSFRVVRR